jgi:hypothetical protein
VYNCQLPNSLRQWLQQRIHWLCHFIGSVKRNPRIIFISLRSWEMVRNRKSHNYRNLCSNQDD